ncbi:MAG: hypothetical protein ABEK01_05060 [Candidatus Nanohaloarchaea archaeon]
MSSEAGEGWDFSGSLLQTEQFDRHDGSYAVFREGDEDLAYLGFDLDTRLEPDRERQGYEAVPEISAAEFDVYEPGEPVMSVRTAERSETGRGETRNIHFTEAGVEEAARILGEIEGDPVAVALRGPLRDEEPESYEKKYEGAMETGYLLTDDWEYLIPASNNIDVGKRAETDTALSTMDELRSMDLDQNREIIYEDMRGQEVTTTERPGHYWDEIE